MCALKKLTPYAIEGVSVFGIMGTGDIIAQTLIEKTPVKEINYARTARFASIGMLFVGPSLRLWYSSMDKFISKTQKPIVRTLKKMALDQLCFAPVFTLAVTGVVGTVNGETTQRIKQRIEEDYITIMQRNYMLWPAAQMINFGLVPVAYQVVFAQVVAIIWNCYLSMMLNKEKEDSLLGGEKK